MFGAAFENGADNPARASFGLAEMIELYSVSTTAQGSGSTFAAMSGVRVMR